MGVFIKQNGLWFSGMKVAGGAKEGGDLVLSGDWDSQLSGSVFISVSSGYKSQKNAIRLEKVVPPAGVAWWKTRRKV